MCQQTSARPLTDPSEPRKVALGDSQERPRAPSGPPSDLPRSSPEPPRQKCANDCRESTNSGRPARAPGTGGHTQPPPLKTYVLTLPHRSSRLSALSGLPSRRTLGVGGVPFGAGAGAGAGCSGLDGPSASRDHPTTELLYCYITTIRPTAVKPCS